MNNPDFETAVRKLEVRRTRLGLLETKGESRESEEWQEAFTDFLQADAELQTLVQDTFDIPEY